MKCTKNTYYYFSLQDHQFFIDSLNALFCKIVCRFVLVISLFILPVLSFGQGLHTEANALPVVGLENLYSVHQKKIEPCLFVASNTIMTKSEGTTFFVNGLTQKDDRFVTQNDLLYFPTALPKETKHKTNPATKVTTTAVTKSTFQATPPILPWKNNPLQQETFFAPMVVVSLPTTPELKKNKIKPLHFFQASEALSNQAVITKGNSVCFIGSVTTTFGKNATEFSSRPPPSSFQLSVFSCQFVASVFSCQLGVIG